MKRHQICYLCDSPQVRKAFVPCIPVCNNCANQWNIKEPVAPDAAPTPPQFPDPKATPRMVDFSGMWNFGGDP